MPRTNDDNSLPDTERTGVIKMFGGNYAPAGYALCDGREYAIADQPDLFAVLSTTYTSDREGYFRIPDMRQRVPLMADGAHYLGQKDGVEAVTLNVDQIPAHTHADPAQNFIDSNTASSAESGSGVQVFNNQIATTGSTGGSQAHTNMQPYFAVNFIIKL